MRNNTTIETKIPVDFSCFLRNCSIPVVEGPPELTRDEALVSFGAIGLNSMMSSGWDFESMLLEPSIGRLEALISRSLGINGTCKTSDRIFEFHKPHFTFCFQVSFTYIFKLFVRHLGPFSNFITLPFNKSVTDSSAIFEPLCFESILNYVFIDQNSISFHSLNLYKYIISVRLFEYAVISATYFYRILKIILHSPYYDIYVCNVL